MNLRFWNRWENFGIGEEKTLGIVWLYTAMDVNHYIWTMDITLLNLTVEVWGYR